MCGIFGHLGHIEEKDALACLSTLSHRGPDGQGLLKVGDLTLGHCRLAILDTSTKGVQPMRYKDRYSITFNGEIYNFIEIRKELKAKGHAFASNSDTEVMLAAYDEWGPKCLDKFNGMWAFALWDDAKKELFLSRDRFGKKPLFYAAYESASGRESFAFSSEMKAIAPLLPTVTADEELLSDVDRIFYYEATDRCLIKEIKRFPAGHYGYIKPGGSLSLSRYWNTLDHVRPVDEPYERQVERLRELFLDSCALRMRSDVTMGTALSGGLDSSAVFSAVSHLSKTQSVERASKDWQHAFCAVFPGTPLDESVYAEKVAKAAGAELERVVVRPEEHVGNLLDQIYRFEDIYITPHIPFAATYGAMKDKGVKVTLDGHGADELFGGYSFDYLHIIHDELLCPDSIRQVLDAYYGSQIDNPQFRTKPRGLFAAEQVARNVAKIALNRKNRSREEGHPAWKRMDYFTQKLYISSHETVLPTLLRNYDRYSMMHGIEIRMPFMDHRIVTYALSLPWQSKIRNGFTKAIIRDAVAPFTPSDIAYRKTKIGFNSPIVDWMRGPLKDYFLSIVGSDSFKKCPFIADPEAVEKGLRQVISDPNPAFSQGEAVWKALLPYLWHEGFYKRIKR